MTIRVWTKEDVQELIRSNDAAVARAILALYARQTADEQRAETTRHHNGVGFNGRDAAFLSSVAKALPRWNNHMTPRQLAAARKMLPKYWRQLCEIANEKEAQKASVADVIAQQQVESRPANPMFGRF